MEVDGHPLALFEKSPADPWGTISSFTGARGALFPTSTSRWRGGALPDGRPHGRGVLDLRPGSQGLRETPPGRNGWLTPDRAARDVVGILQWLYERTGGRPALFGWSYGSMVAQLRPNGQESSYPPSSSSDTPWTRHRVLRRRTSASKSHLGRPPPPRPPRATSSFQDPSASGPRGIRAPCPGGRPGPDVLAGSGRMEGTGPRQDSGPDSAPPGGEDPLARTSRQAAFFSRLGTPDRSWVTIPGGDHAAHLETPRPRFIQALVSFLRRPRPGNESR